MHLITATGIDLAYAGQRVLHGVDIAIAAGEIVTIVGPNGSGKSTLLRVRIGALRAHSGQVIRKPGLRIGYLPQKLHIDATMPMTVARFLSLPVRQSAARVSEALQSAGAAGLAARQMSELSGGQFQRVLLARAILDRPEILMLDEATQGLD